MMNNRAFERVVLEVADKLDTIAFELLEDESSEARVVAEVASSIASYLRDENSTLELSWRVRYEKLLAFLTDRNWSP
jgi:hypothetical protein